MDPMCFQVCSRSNDWFGWLQNSRTDALDEWVDLVFVLPYSIQEYSCLDTIYNAFVPYVRMEYMAPVVHES